MMHYCRFETPLRAVNTLSGELMRLSQEESSIHIAISGGSTPLLWYQTMATEPFAEAICWPVLHFWWADERCVPPENAESNYGQVNSMLFDRVALPRKNIHRIRGEAEPEEEAGRMAEEMERLLPRVENEPIFDWVILGVGTDGHTASLFPGKTNFADTHLAVVSVQPKSQQRRISLSARQLGRCRRMTYLVTGSDKAKRIQRIYEQLENTPTDPAARIQSLYGKTEWYLDALSASLLP